MFDVSLLHTHAVTKLVDVIKWLTMLHVSALTIKVRAYTLLVCSISSSQGKIILYDGSV